MTPPHLSAGILATDQYQLTMAQVYFRQGLHQRRARFDWFFRSYPDYGEHQAGYAIAAGLEWLVEWMERTVFTADDVAALAAQRQHQYRQGSLAHRAACEAARDGAIRRISFRLAQALRRSHAFGLCTTSTR